MATNPNGATPALVERARNIILKPGLEWPRIDAEPATIGGIYRSYVLVLAAIAPIAGVIGQLVFTRSAFGIVYRPSMQWVVCTALIQYALALLSVYLLALVIEALAANFGGTKDRVQAFKLSAYAATAAWLAGIFNLVPTLAWLAMIGGLYSLYLLYLGLPVLMKVPADKTPAYFVAVLVAAVLLWIVAGALLTAIVGALVGSATPGPVSIEFSG